MGFTLFGGECPFGSALSDDGYHIRWVTPAQLPVANHGRSEAGGVAKVIGLPISGPAAERSVAACVNFQYRLPWPLGGGGWLPASRFAVMTGSVSDVDLTGSGVSVATKERDRSSTVCARVRVYCLVGRMTSVFLPWAWLHVCHVPLRLLSLSLAVSFMYMEAPVSSTGKRCG